MAYINEYFEIEQVSPQHMDMLWAMGWRHFGGFFFRYERLVTKHGIRTVMPLRIELSKFSLSKSQKRILKKNSDLTTLIQDAVIDQPKKEIFQRHKTRFTENIPDSLHTFLGYQPAHIPCHTQEVCLFYKDQLLAASFLDLGQAAASSIYAIYEPTEAKRSLGIYLILLSIDYAIKLGKEYYYPGYAYKEPSHYDYKKKFIGLEYYNWQDSWCSLSPELIDKE